MRAFHLALRLASPAAIIVALAGCGGTETNGGGGQGGNGNTGPANGPTFHKDVEPILQKHCQSCHSPGNIAPFGLIEYGDAKLVHKLMKDETQSRSMPPWGAFDTSECTVQHPWQQDLRLSDDDIATIADWSDNGAPEGDPADAPPPI